MKKTILMAGLVALSLGCWLANSPGNADTERSSEAASPFKGGIIVVVVKATPPDQYYNVPLEGAAVYELGKRYFLVGTVADDGDPHWSDGKRRWLPMDDVMGTQSFPTSTNTRMPLTSQHHRTLKNLALKLTHLPKSRTSYSVCGTSYNQPTPRHRRRRVSVTSAPEPLETLATP